MAPDSLQEDSPYGSYWDPMMTVDACFGSQAPDVGGYANVLIHVSHDDFYPIGQRLSFQVAQLVFTLLSHIRAVLSSQVANIFESSGLQVMLLTAKDSGTRDAGVA